MRYQIRIDNELYESCDNYRDAIALFKTVDRTILQQYHGLEKKLIRLVGDKEEVLATGIIGD